MNKLKGIVALSLSTLLITGCNVQVTNNGKDEGSANINIETKTERNDTLGNTNQNWISNINKRLYSVNSDLNQQRYYLLLDDATYGEDENFLNKKTYILDMNMVEGNEIVKEIDLSSIFKPIADEYINSYEGDKNGTCSVEYFSATTGALTPPPIDYDKEVAFKAYYRCIDNNHIEHSLGYESYAYNVENNTIRSLN